MASKSIAEACYIQQDYTRSITYAKKWLFEAKRVEDTLQERSALKIIAWSYYYLRNYEESIKYGNQEFRIAKEEEDEEGELEAYELLARSHRTYVERGRIGTDLEGRTSDIDADPQVLQMGSIGNEFLA